MGNLLNRVGRVVDVATDVDLSTLNIVAVEDDSGGAALLNMMLRRMKINFAIDRTGLQVIPLALSMVPPPDIFLLDLNVPGRSGFDIIGDIRQTPPLAAKPVIAVSALDAHLAVPRCKEAGFDGFIAKPLSAEHLAQQLGRIRRGEAVWDTNWMVR